MKDNEILPPNVTVYHGKKKSTYYYRVKVNGNRTKIPVGNTYAEMMEKLREIQNHGSMLPKTLAQIWEKYSTTDLLEREPSTQKDYARCWGMISKVLGKYKLEDIQSYHIKQYISARAAKTRGNREKALISILFNYAKEHGYYNNYNPCLGIKGNKETGRDRYISKWEYEEIYNHGDQVLKDAMDVLLYTGQRVSDVLKMKTKDFREALLPAESTKTHRKVNIVIEGEFKNVIERILNRDTKIKSMFLIAHSNGQKVSLSTLEHKFARARAAAGFKSYDIQLRDLRAKSASDDTLENANLRLMHTTTTMTEKYRRKHKGATVRPLQKLI